jgi:hypothetical protein
MAHRVVKILSGDDYEKRENPVWCLIVKSNGDSATFCDTEFFGYGASACRFETKEVEKGGITCPNCLEKIKLIQSINLDENVQ